MTDLSLASQSFAAQWLGQYMPHGSCYLWQSNLIWLHVLSDGLTAIAYYSIPITLLYFVRRRQDLPFDWVFLLFGAFIVACGTTHLMEIWTLWKPDYWLSGYIKAMTAAVSVYTAIQLIPLVPKALALPSPAQLEAANQSLQQEVEARQQAEAQVRKINDELEFRIAERTQELEQANRLQRQLLNRERQARKDAEQANRIKDEFVTTLSHELRTPLNAIAGWTQLIQRRDCSSDTLEKGINVIERNAQSLTHMIEDILDMSRIVRGQVRMLIQPVDLRHLIETAVDSVTPAANARNVAIQLHLSDYNDVIQGDAHRLQQVVWNLLSNAVKFTPGGGQIDVFLTTDDDQVQITVVDTGQGIDASFLPHVFEYFRQADGSITRSRNGLGLGLAIVRHLVELHGGTITADSPGLNQGSTFTVSLPYVSALNSSRQSATPLTAIPLPHSELSNNHRIPTSISSVPSQTRQTDQAERSDGQASDRIVSDSATNDGKTDEAKGAVALLPNLSDLSLLLVEDDDSSREFLAFTLEVYGAQVQPAASVQEAIRLLELTVPDAIVSDIAMPNQDGYVLIRYLQNQPRLANLPVVAVTAYASQEEQARIQQAGFYCCLPKPVQIDRLVAVLQSCRSRSQSSGVESAC
ncbi:MAG: ATP-binding protein [Thainema sp.]